MRLSVSNTSRPGTRCRQRSKEPAPTPAKAGPLPFTPKQECPDSEEVVDDYSKHAQGALIFETFSRFIEFLQTQFGILVEVIVVDQLAHGALSAAHLFDDLPQAGQSGRSIFVKFVI